MGDDSAFQGGGGPNIPAAPDGGRELRRLFLGIRNVHGADEQRQRQNQRNEEDAAALHEWGLLLLGNLQLGMRPTELLYLTARTIWAPNIQHKESTATASRNQSHR